MQNYSQNQTFEQLLVNLVQMHKLLVSDSIAPFPQHIRSTYRSQAKSYSTPEYIKITALVQNHPEKFLSLDNRYFSNLQRVSELMEYADASYRKMRSNDPRNVDNFRQSLTEKARVEVKAYYSQFDRISNPNGRTTTSAGSGK